MPTTRSPHADWRMPTVSSAHYGVFGPAEVWTKAASSAVTAVMLDAESAEAHTSLAHVKSTQDWDWSDAEREFQRAISLNPRYATAHHWYAMSCLAPLGRLDEALDELMIAQSLDPVSSIVARDLAVIHFYRRDFEIGARAVRSHHRAEPALRAGVLDAGRDPGAAQGLRRVGRGLPARGASCRRRRRACTGRSDARSRYPGRRKQALEVLQKLETYAKERLRLAARIRVDSVRAGRSRPGLQVAREGVRRSRVRSDLDQSRSKV